MTVTPAMIHSIKDVYGFCDGKTPCNHSDIDIELTDGRKITTLLSSEQIANILAAMNKGREHALWNHFARYHRNQENHDLVDILTVLFERIKK